MGNKNDYEVPDLKVEKTADPEKENQTKDLNIGIEGNSTTSTDVARKRVLRNHHHRSRLRRVASMP